MTQVLEEKDNFFCLARWKTSQGICMELQVTRGQFLFNTASLVCEGCPSIQCLKLFGEKEEFTTVNNTTEENASVGDFCRTYNPSVTLAKPIIFEVFKSCMRQIKLLDVRQQFR